MFGTGNINLAKTEAGSAERGARSWSVLTQTGVKSILERRVGTLRRNNGAVGKPNANKAQQMKNLECMFDVVVGIASCRSEPRHILAAALLCLPIGENNNSLGFPKSCGA